MSAPAKQATAPPKTYYSSGQALSSPPLAARIRSFFDDAYAFAGLYVTTLFSTDAYEAAQNSPFSTQGRNAVRGGARASSWTGGQSTGSGGGGQPRTLGNSFGFNLGSTNEVRVPGCGSCG